MSVANSGSANRQAQRKASASDMSATEKSYMTKMTRDEYAQSEDIVEVLRARRIEYERDLPPGTADELYERSWP